jgi:ATP-dependent protease ClpP protease subunit
MSLKTYTSLKPVADLPELLALFGTKTSPRGQRASGSWYSIRNISDDDAEIFIYDEIGYWGVTANDFIGDLRAIKASKIALHINSPGGDVFDGVAIFNALVRHKAQITVSVDGIAASAASFIAMAGDEVVMAPHSQMMIHEASGLCIGAADDMRKLADILDKSSDNIASIYAERTGKPVAEFRELMKDETWFSDVEAVEAGLADRIDGEDEEAAAARAAIAIRNAEDGDTPEPIDWAAFLKDVSEREPEAAAVE